MCDSPSLHAPLRRRTLGRSNDEERVNRVIFRRFQGAPVREIEVRRAAPPPADTFGQFQKRPWSS